MSLVEQFLKSKDQDYSKYIPPGYKMTDNEKEKFLHHIGLKAKYQITAATRCMKPCFKNFNTPVITENESECMTNCVGKSLETLALLQIQFA
jgi:hypothetical protein